MPNISIHRLSSRLIGFVGALLIVSKLWAQQTPQNYDDHWAHGNAPYSNAYPSEHKAIEPFAPVGFTQKLQPFAPVDVSDYGNGPRARRGFFFSYERLDWSISRPSTAQIGSPEAVGVYKVPPAEDFLYQYNTVDTSNLRSKFGWGNRWDFGYMDFNDYGWLCSIIDHLNVNQYYQTDDPTILFRDPQNLLNGVLDGSATVVTFIPKFESLYFSQNTLMSGVEIMRMYRLPRLHHGGIMELICGVRFLQLQDKFYAEATGTAAGYPVEQNPMSDVFLNMRVQNNIIGPQIGLRYYHQRGRWLANLELRVFTAANFQNTRQDSVVATQLVTPPDIPVVDQPTNLQSYGARVWSSQDTFTPGVEFRVGTSYMITRAFALKVGYTAMYLGGISRAANRIDWALPTIGIINGNNHENVFINGLNFGFEFSH